MLATLNTSMWSARKHDKKITQEVADNHGTATDVGRYNKKLLAKENLETIRKCVTAARLHHYDNTMPWDNVGTRLLPVANYFEYGEAQRQFASEFETAVQMFVDEYPTYVEAARVRLNSLFNPDDYPSPLRIRSKFRMDVTMMPMPNEDDFRVSLNDDEVARIRDDISATVQQRLQDASDDLWTRLYDTVKHMHDRLTAFKDKETKRLHESLIGNLTELTSMLTRLNFTDDPNLEAMRAEIETSLCRYDIGALRNSESARVEQADAAKAVLDKMASYMGDPS